MKRGIFIGAVGSIISGVVLHYLFSGESSTKPEDVIERKREVKANLGHMKFP